FRAFCAVVMGLKCSPPAHDEIYILGSHQVDLRRMHSGKTQPGSHRLISAFFRPLDFQGLDVNICGYDAFNACGALGGQGITGRAAKIEYVSAAGQECAELASLQAPDLSVVLRYCENRDFEILAERWQVI